MQKRKILSIGKKFRGIVSHGFDPLDKGVHNFNHPTAEIEALAKLRTSECLGCLKFKIEPVEFLRVTDERIPELSNMFCDACGCTSSYKLRQSLITCPLWQK